MEPAEIEPNDVETTKILVAKILISSLLYWYTLREVLELFMDLAWNDVTVNIKGGATRHNSKQLCQASFVINKFCHNVP